MRHLILRLKPLNKIVRFATFIFTIGGFPIDFVTFIFAIHNIFLPENFGMYKHTIGPFLKIFS